MAQIILSQQGNFLLPSGEFYVRQVQKQGHVLRSETIGYFVPVILVCKGNSKRHKVAEGFGKAGHES